MKTIFKVGDIVYDLKEEEQGVVTDILSSTDSVLREYPIYVKFEGSRYRTYTKDGKSFNTDLLPNLSLIKINEISSPEFEIYTPDNILLGIIDEYEFLDIRVQIKKSQLSGYYILFNNQKVIINKDGSLDHYPEGLLDTMSKYYSELIQNWETMKTKIEALEQQLAELKAEFEKNQKPEQPKKWQDKLVQPINEVYYYIDNSSCNRLCVKRDIRSNRKPEHAFRTKEQAELEKEKMLLMIEMHAFAHVMNEGWTADWEDDEQEKWGIGHDEIIYKKFEVIQGWLSNSFIFGVTVRSWEIAKEMLFIFGEKILKYYNQQY